MADARNASVVDPRLAKALSHPLRARIFVILNERIASPNEIAEMLDERLPNVSYHVRALAELDCIELVRTAQRRGAIEHYYQAIKRPFFSDRDWKRMPRSGRQAIIDLGLQMVWDDVAEAIEAGTLEARSDIHFHRTPLVIDEEGWRELSSAISGVLKDAERIAGRSRKRLAKSKESGISTRLVVMHFESPS